MLTTEILKTVFSQAHKYLTLHQLYPYNLRAVQIKHEIDLHEEFHQQNVDKPKPFSTVFSSTPSTTSSGREEYQVIKGDILAKIFKFGESYL